MRYLSRFALLTAATALSTPAFAAPAQSAAIPSLVRQVSIPHTMFKLKNGLTVIVHEDHKAPVAAVAIWYNVGAKDEPKGKTGFAHLFEHLMFNGSENLQPTLLTVTPVPGAFPVVSAGSLEAHGNSVLYLHGLSVTGEVTW